MDVGEQPVVDVAGLDVADQPHRRARRQQLAQAGGRLGAVALDGRVAVDGLGRVDADEPDGRLAAAEVDDQRVAVDHPDDGGRPAGRPPAVGRGRQQDERRAASARDDGRGRGSGAGWHGRLRCRAARGRRGREPGRWGAAGSPVAGPAHATGACVIVAGRGRWRAGWAHPPGPVEVNPLDDGSVSSRRRAHGDERGRRSARSSSHRLGHEKVPVQPSGWPRAMAPPLGLVRSGRRPPRCQASTTGRRPR